MIRKLGEINEQSFMLFDRVGPASFFGPQAFRMSPAEIVGFYMPKPTNTLRIILVGESAIKGFPQPYAFTAASILQEMLKYDLPGKTIEVLNFGTTAVASYPVLKITEAAAQCDPDLVFAMVGHNEFFGAYGVVSTRYLDSRAGLFDLDYYVRHTAIAQAIGKIISSSAEPQRKQLMEMMAGMDFIPQNSPLRERAFGNLSRHVKGIVQACKSSNVPLILCVPPGNENDLAPVGKDPDTQQGARFYFQQGKKAQAKGSFDEAMTDFQTARDLDTMPWRASRRMQDMIRSMGTNVSVRICDIDQAFRGYGSTNGIGWNLMDDHVHPNIDGQFLMARAMRDSALQIIQPEKQTSNLMTSGDYLNQLGDNVYDRYGVAYTMAMLFNIPFLAESNPEAKILFEKKSSALLRQIPSETHDAIRRWQLTADLVIGKRPLSGQVGMELLRLNKPGEAIPLLTTAIRSVPPYSSWAMEYTYYLLASIKKLNGFLGESERVLAEKTMERGSVILSLGQASSGQTERFIGRILQLFDKHQDAITFLQQARQKLTGMERVANDRALIEAYQKTGQKSEADRIIKEGLEGDPAFAQYYR